jgi:hypothetical protein
MSRHLIRDAYAKLGGKPACQDVTLKYLDGGKRSEYTFKLAGREPVVVVWDKAGNDTAIAGAAIEKLAANAT